MSGELGSYDTVVGNMGDRNDLALWWSGSSMVEAVAAVNKNTIVVIHSVGPVKYAHDFVSGTSELDDIPQHEMVKPSKYHGYRLCRCSRGTNWARSS